MRLSFLGTGCPVAHPVRFGPAHLVRTAQSAVLIDCGSGVSQRLVEIGCPGRDLDAVLLTHLHSDHIVDLFQLIISSWHQGRSRPPRIYGPRGTRRYVDGLMALWRPELEQRIAHERRPSAVALQPEVHEFTAGPVGDFTDLAVEAVEVDHKPVENAFGFVFRGEGATLVLSGDTARSPALISAGAGADLLVHEVFSHRDMPVIEGVRTAEGTANVARYHTLSSEVGKVALEMGAAALALTHFVPPAADRDALLDEVRQDFAGPVILGEDLMTVDVGRRTLAWGNARLSYS
ncbi:MAG: MBL fold metallo-hydrolase [Alphaproteobacteria bacterium]